MKSFNELKISKAMKDNLNSLNYLEMTQIQEASIPKILSGTDLMAQAKTGSGKTAAFGIGLLEHLKVEMFRVQSMVICPTRELAEQVTNELRRLARFKHNIKLLTLTGGIPMRKQEHSLSHQAHIVVGTPGRLCRLLQRDSLNLKDLNMLVLDEADRMLDMGFISEMEDIFDYLPNNVQTLCFSATFPKEIKEFCSTFLQNPQEVIVEKTHNPNIIKQHFVKVSGRDKIKKIVDILNHFKPESLIIFCNTKDNCRRVKAELGKNNITSLAIHGDLEQKDRTEALIRFSNGSSRILVATDVAARGLDISGLKCVINYDMPFETQTYIHRIGRTGRAGESGLVFSLLNQGEDFRLDEINDYLKSRYITEDMNFTSEAENPYPEPEMVTLSINGGRKNKISPGDILGALTSSDGLEGADIGKIDRLDFLTFVAVKKRVSVKGLKIIESRPIKGRMYKSIIHKGDGILNSPV